MKRFFRNILILFIFLILPFFVEKISAQPPPPDPQDIPLDGGLTFLIIAGAAYGARKLHKNQQEEQENK
jgi:hypothetical protein